jgi:hypothetical protein
MNTVHPEHAPVQHHGAIEHLALSLRIANRAVITDIELNACRVDLDGAIWWDLRPMLDEREHSAIVCDMAREALAYAGYSHLITAHPQHIHLVRINAPAHLHTLHN